MPRKKIPQHVIDAAYTANEFVGTRPSESARLKGEKGPSRIMYIENKSEGLPGGEARIGCVTFSKTGRTIYYRGKAFSAWKRGFKANYRDKETGEDYWISGPKKNGEDRLYSERVPIEIDEDVREEYWTVIRGLVGQRRVGRV